MSETSLNPESHGEGEQSRKRVKTGTEVKMKRPLIGCGGGLKLKLKDQVADKSLFFCTNECYWDRPNYRPPPARYQPWDSSYVVRSISLSDLLTSSDKLELRELARLDDRDLPGEVGCGVLGSKIVFASGLKPNFDPDRFGPPFGPDSSTDAYAFDIRDPKHEIIKMPGALNGGKHSPLVIEFAGKLYVLSYKWGRGSVSFEVYDPQQGTWSLLPSYPDAGRCYPYSTASYTILGTKLFMSTSFVDPSADCSVCCFNFAAGEWRRVPSMCQGGDPLPFAGQAVAVDMPQPEHSNKKLLFSASRGHSWINLVVHLMSLDENQEDIIEIMETELPAELPSETWSNDCHFFHLGGNNVLLVTTTPADSPNKSGIYTGAAVLFQFEFDISKVDKDRKNCFSVQFQSPRIFRYQSSPDCMSPPDTLGCFLL